LKYSTGKINNTGSEMQKPNVFTEREFAIMLAGIMTGSSVVYLILSEPDVYIKFSPIEDEPFAIEYEIVASIEADKIADETTKTKVAMVAHRMASELSNAWIDCLSQMSIDE
jgi:hypothetical protein